MSQKKVTLVYSLKNTFVLKDIELLEQMGYKVFTIHSPPYSDFVRFSWNRIKEFFLGFFLLAKSKAVFSWFNDYHTAAAFFWAHARRLCIAMQDQQGERKKMHDSHDDVRRLHVARLEHVAHRELERSAAAARPSS